MCDYQDVSVASIIGNNRVPGPYHWKHTLRLNWPHLSGLFWQYNDPGFVWYSETMLPNWHKHTLTMLCTHKSMPLHDMSFCFHVSQPSPPRAGEMTTEWRKIHSHILLSNFLSVYNSRKWPQAMSDPLFGHSFCWGYVGVYDAKQNTLISVGVICCHNKKKKIREQSLKLQLQRAGHDTMLKKLTETRRQGVWGLHSICLTAGRQKTRCSLWVSNKHDANFLTWSFQGIVHPIISENYVQHRIFNECFVAQVIP